MKEQVRKNNPDLLNQKDSGEKYPEVLAEEEIE